jgi:hypothetical protein
LAALIAYLTVVCRMPRRVVEALLRQVLGIEISLVRIPSHGNNHSEVMKIIVPR